MTSKQLSPVVGQLRELDSRVSEYQRHKSLWNSFTTSCNNMESVRLRKSGTLKVNLTNTELLSEEKEPEGEMKTDEHPCSKSVQPVSNKML